MKKKSGILVPIILFLLLAVGVGFALLQTDLKITGTTNISGNTWDLHFGDLYIPDGSVATRDSIDYKNTNPDDNLNLVFTANLNVPGDVYEFMIDVVNDGSIDAMLDTFEKTPEIVAPRSNYLEYDVFWYGSEGNLVPEKNQGLKSRDMRTLVVRVKYKDNIDSGQLPASSDPISMSIQLKYIQADEDMI